jgi:hypothetical protein
MSRNLQAGARSGCRAQKLHPRLRLGVFPPTARLAQDSKALTMMETAEDGGCKDGSTFGRPGGWQVSGPVGRLHAETSVGSTTVEIKSDDQECVVPTEQAISQPGAAAFKASDLQIGHRCGLCLPLSRGTLLT